MTEALDEEGAGLAGELSPAAKSGDARFIAYAQSCTAAAAAPDPQKCIAELTRALVKDWRMPDQRYLQCQPDAPYGSYLLYLSETGDLCIVLDVFMAEQAAIVHNHLCWCVFSCLEGVERETLFNVPDDLSAAPVETLSRLRRPGEVTMADAARGAFHQVACAEGDLATSLHIYGADIGMLQRQKWSSADAAYVQFRSGYSNALVGLPAYLTATDARAHSVI